MSDWTLVVDVGNTSTSFGVYHANRIERRGRIPTDEAAPGAVARALDDAVRGRRIARAVLCSVAPSHNEVWRAALRERSAGAVIEVSHRIPLGVPVSYPSPDSIGADRLANAAGAVFRYGAPVIVADFGTALTFDVVSRTKGYIGGIIAPGLPLMFSYLAEKTELLPHIDPQPVRRRVGKSTEEAMRIGARYGYRGMIREILAEVRKGIRGEPAVCATGGYARWVLRGLGEEIIFDPDLTLIGLGRIGELQVS